MSPKALASLGSRSPRTVSHGRQRGLPRPTVREALAGQPEGWPSIDCLQVRRLRSAPLSRSTVRLPGRKRRRASDTKSYGRGSGYGHGEWFEQALRVRGDLSGSRRRHGPSGRRRRAAGRRSPRHDHALTTGATPQRQRSASSPVAAPRLPAASSVATDAGHGMAASTMVRQRWTRVSEQPRAMHQPVELRPRARRRLTSRTCVTAASAAPGVSLMAGPACGIDPAAANPLRLRPTAPRRRRQPRPAGSSARAGPAFGWRRTRASVPRSTATTAQLDGRAAANSAGRYAAPRRARARPAVLRARRREAVAETVDRVDGEASFRPPARVVSTLRLRLERDLRRAPSRAASDGQVDIRDDATEATASVADPAHVGKLPARP